MKAIYDKDMNRKLKMLNGMPMKGLRRNDDAMKILAGIKKSYFICSISVICVPFIFT
jgi:hypothetical protein